MRIARWLREVDARLSVHLEMTLDPVAGTPEYPWHCTITDFRNPSADRPATFLVDDKGEDTEGNGRGSTPQEAWERAVYSLCGLTLSVIGQGRDEKHVVPADLRP